MGLHTPGAKEIRRERRRRGKQRRENERGRREERKAEKALYASNMVVRKKQLA